MCPVVLKAFPAGAEIGAVSVEAVGESMADLGLAALIYIQAFGATSFITTRTLAVKGILLLVASGNRVTVATGVQTNVFTHAGPLTVHCAQDTGTHIGTRGVGALHVHATSRH